MTQNNVLPVTSLVCTKPRAPAEPGGVNGWLAGPALPQQRQAGRTIQLRARDPVLRLAASNIDASGATFEAFEANYPGDRAVFEAVVRRSDEADLFV